MANIPHSESAVPESSLGHHYQWAVALVTLLQRALADPGAAVAIEKIDDVSDHSETGTTLVSRQLKHLTPQRELNSYSKELWRTLKGWLPLFTSTDDRINSCRFELYYTCNVDSSSALRYLYDDHTRQPELARREIVGVANTSNNKAHLGAYQAFQALGPSRQVEFLQRVYLVKYPQIDDAIRALRPFSRSACGQQQVLAFEDRIVGWWVRRVIEHMRGNDAGLITGAELLAHWDDTREHFKRTALVIDDDIFDLPIPKDLEDPNRIFLQQLGLIAADNTMLRNAISDYYCAYVQRSRWIDENIVIAVELERYEKKLLREWRRHFERQAAATTGKAAEEKRLAGRKLHDTMTFEIAIPIRPDVTDPMIQRGSCQMLADDQKLGWHPEFVDLLRAIRSQSAS